MINRPPTPKGKYKKRSGKSVCKAKYSTIPNHKGGN